MNLVTIYEDGFHEYQLTPEAINLVVFSKGILYLPKMKNLCQLKIIFMSPGNFLINSGNLKIELGNMIGSTIAFEIGKGGFDTQPNFLFNPETQKWYMISQGMAIFFDDELTAQKEMDKIRGLNNEPINSTEILKIENTNE